MTNGHYRFLLTTTGCCWRLPTIVTHVNLPAEAHTNPWLRSRRYSFRNGNIFYRVETFDTGKCTDALHQISKDTINYRHRNIFVRRPSLNFCLNCWMSVWPVDSHYSATLLSGGTTGYKCQMTDCCQNKLIKARPSIWPTRWTSEK